MNQTTSFSAEAIEAEYHRLGHKLGWRLFTCPVQNIETASAALITINPGGDTFEKQQWSVEAGSAYEIERWKNRPPGQENLQLQIRRMFEIIDVKPAEALSGYFVPFRSRSWAELPEKAASKEFGMNIWRNILDRASARTVIALGKDTAKDLTKLLNANSLREHQAHWGEQTIDSYRYGREGKLIVLPHLSRFALFNRPAHPESEQVFRQAVFEAR